MLAGTGAGEALFGTDLARLRGVARGRQQHWLLQLLLWGDALSVCCAEGQQPQRFPGGLQRSSWSGFCERLADAGYAISETNDCIHGVPLRSYRLIWPEHNTEE